jgi:hypothetical protein
MSFSVHLIEFNADGVLADALVDDFGGSLMTPGGTNVPPLDWTLCLTAMEYGSAAAVLVRIIFEPALAAAAELQKEIVNVTQQYFVWNSVIVPRTVTGIPFVMAITKAATNARLGYKYEWLKPGGC